MESKKYFQAAKPKKLIQRLEEKKKIKIQHATKKVDEIKKKAAKNHKKALLKGQYK